MSPYKLDAICFFFARHDRVCSDVPCFSIGNVYTRFGRFIHPEIKRFQGAEPGGPLCMFELNERPVVQGRELRFCCSPELSNMTVDNFVVTRLPNQRAHCGTCLPSPALRHGLMHLRCYPHTSKSAVHS